MQLLRTLSYTLLLQSSANAFRLTFYVGKECNGEQVDSVSNVGGTCTVCSYANTSKMCYPDEFLQSTGLVDTNAESVEIEKDTSDPSGGRKLLIYMICCAFLTTESRTRISHFPRLYGSNNNYATSRLC